MPCYHPLTAYRTPAGDVVFDDGLAPRVDRSETLTLPCGRCIGCRLERSREMAMRCVHEAAMHRRNCFVTLTYDQDHVPVSGSLEYRAFQLFLKRVRRHFAPGRVRFYMCGEYGGQFGRPHFHSILFGQDFDDRVFLRTTDAGARLYTSGVLERLWPYGISSVGDVTFESAAYIARYCVQKVTGAAAKEHYGSLTPEFNHGSLKPGIGASFFDRFESDIYPANHCVCNGKEVKPPRYYAKRYQRRSAFAAQLYEDFIGYEAEQEARSRWQDNTAERLAVKEQVQAARAAFLVRSLE